RVFWVSSPRSKQEFRSNTQRAGNFQPCSTHWRSLPPPLTTVPGAYMALSRWRQEEEGAQ
ncbi:MAG: hypothetical protein P8I79_01465, partial [Amylibacter sp.]|nr:hypothetical protein [Amylibacter sp.]